MPKIRWYTNEHLPLCQSFVAKLRPTFSFERDLSKRGYQWILGVDEAGCGALAGPVVASAVCFPFNSRLAEVADSKLLSEAKREELYDLILKRARAVGVGCGTLEEIETIGIRQATYLAMRRAIAQVPQADFALVDAWTIPELSLEQQGVIKGDQKIKSIAAASIIAKVTRDRIMERMHIAYPVYGFHEHKGYGTKKHRAAIEMHGPCPIHRLSYKTFHQTLDV